MQRLGEVVSNLQMATTSLEAQRDKMRIPVFVVSELSRFQPTASWKFVFQQRFSFKPKP